jgi:hypothetical protein
MPPLRELQLDFMQALLAAAPEDAVRWLDLPEDRALPRLRVYQGTVRGNFEDALRSTFPAVERLVGEDYFRQTAREFQRLRPSRAGDLATVGALFPAHLHAVHRQPFEYLADVARLEWLIQESLLAAEPAPLDLQRLGRVPPAAYPALRFRCHPALRLFESPYPALRIWEANVSSGELPESIDLGAGADRLVIMRRRLRLEFHRLSAGEEGFLAAIVAAEPFGAAIERAAAAAAAAAADLEFDATAALGRFVAAEALVDFDF